MRSNSAASGRTPISPPVRSSGTLLRCWTSCYQNPGISVRGLLGSDQFRYAQNAVKEEQTDDSLAEFEL